VLVVDGQFSSFCRKLIKKELKHSLAKCSPALQAAGSRGYSDLCHISGGFRI
jgi:hypothetical protein